MKLRDYNYDEIYNTIEILHNIDQIMLDYPVYESKPDFNLTKKFLNRIHNIHESMPEDYKMRYSNNFFKNIDLSFLKKEKEEFQITIKSLEKYSEDKARKVIRWANELIEMIDELDHPMDNIDSVYRFFDIVIKTCDQDKYAELYHIIYDECLGYLNHMHNYLLSLDFYMKAR